jgi:hypothetical protein
LAQLVAGVIGAAVAVPFAIVAQVLLIGTPTTAVTLVADVLVAVGGAIGAIITEPFSAGANVLLYTDRRIRAEAFDLVLQTGAAGNGSQPADSTDHLWLTSNSQR